MYEQQQQGLDEPPFSFEQQQQQGLDEPPFSFEQQQQQGLEEPPFSFEQFKTASEAFVYSGDRKASAFIESILQTRCQQLKTMYENGCSYNNSAQRNVNNSAGYSNWTTTQVGGQEASSATTTPAPPIFPHLVQLTGFISDILSFATQQHLADQQNVNNRQQQQQYQSQSNNNTAAFSATLFTAVLLLKRFIREWLPQFVAFEKKLLYFGKGRGGGGPNKPAQQGGFNGGGINYNSISSNQLRQQQQQQQQSMLQAAAPPSPMTQTPSLIDASTVSPLFVWILDATPTAQSCVSASLSSSPLSSSTHLPISLSDKLLAVLLQLRGLLVDVLVALIGNIQRNALSLSTSSLGGNGVGMAPTDGGAINSNNNIPVEIWSKDPIIKMLLHTIGVLEVLVWTEEPHCAAAGGGGVGLGGGKQTKWMRSYNGNSFNGGGNNNNNFNGYNNDDEDEGGASNSNSKNNKTPAASLPAVRLAQVCHHVLALDIAFKQSSPNVIENVMGHFTQTAPSSFVDVMTTSQSIASLNSNDNNNGYSAAAAPAPPTLSTIAIALNAEINQIEQQYQQQTNTKFEQQYQQQTNTNHGNASSLNVSGRIVDFYQRLTSLLYVADRLGAVGPSGLQNDISSSASSSASASLISPNDVAIVGNTNIFTIVLFILRNVVEALVDHRIRIDFMMRAKVRSSMQLGKEVKTNGSSSSSCMCASILNFIEMGLEQSLARYNNLFTVPGEGEGQTNVTSSPPFFATLSAAVAGTTESLTRFIADFTMAMAAISSSSVPLSSPSHACYPSPTSPFWPSSLATILFFIQLSTETLTMCISAAIETLSLSGQIGVGGGGNSSATSTTTSAAATTTATAKPVSPWGESFWLLLQPIDPLGMGRSDNFNSSSSLEDYEDKLAVLFASTKSNGGAADQKVCKSLLWDFILKSGFVLVHNNNNGMAAAAGTSSAVPQHVRPPLLFSLATALKQMAEGSSSSHFSDAITTLMQQPQQAYNAVLGSFNPVLVSMMMPPGVGGSVGGVGSGSNSRAQLRILSKQLRSHGENLPSSVSSVIPNIASAAYGGGGGSASASLLLLQQQQQQQHVLISSQEDCPLIEVAFCDLIVKIFEVIGVEGTCSIGCQQQQQNTNDATVNNNGGGGGYGDYYDENGGYDDAYASSEFYFDICSIASAAILRGLRFIQPTTAATSATCNSGDGALLSLPSNLLLELQQQQMGVMAPPASIFASVAVTAVSHVSLKPLFLACFMGISEAAVPLLDATTEKYVSGAVEVSCPCCTTFVCYSNAQNPSFLRQQQQLFSSAEAMTAAIITHGNNSLRAALFSVFNTTLSQIIVDPVAFTVPPPINSMLLRNASRQQQQQIGNYNGDQQQMMMSSASSSNGLNSSGSNAIVVAVQPTVPLAFPLIALLTQRSQPVSMNSVNAIQNNSNSNSYSYQQQQGNSHPPTTRGSISVVRVLDIRLCAALELVSPSLAGLTMICQALAPQSIPPMDEEADDPEDFGFSVVDTTDGENVRKRLTIAGLFSSPSSSSSMAMMSQQQTTLQAPLLLPADSFFIAAATKVASHCLTSFSTAMKIEMEMFSSHGLLSGFLANSNQQINNNPSNSNSNNWRCSSASVTATHSSSLLLTELLNYLMFCDDATLLYGTEFHESVLHHLGDRSIGGGGGGGSGHEDEGNNNNHSASNSSDGSSRTVPSDILGSALLGNGVSSVPISGVDMSTLGALAAEGLLNHQANRGGGNNTNQMSPNASVSVNFSTMGSNTGNNSSSSASSSGSGTSSAFRNGFVDVHKHSIAAFVSAFLHLSGIANTSITTRRSILLYLIVGAIHGQNEMNNARIAAENNNNGNSTGNPFYGTILNILAPLTLDQLAVGRRASDGGGVCGAVYMTAHDDEQTDNNNSVNQNGGAVSHAQELMAALNALLASSSPSPSSPASVIVGPGVGSTIVNLTVDPVVSPPEATVLQLMALSSSNVNNNNGNGNGNKHFAPFSVLQATLMGNMASGVGEMEIIPQQPIAFTCCSTAPTQQQQQQMMMAATANGTTPSSSSLLSHSNIVTSFTNMSPPHQLSQMLQQRTNSVRSNVFSLALESACVPMPFAILRASASFSGSSASSTEEASLLNNMKITAASLSHTRCTEINNGWVNSLHHLRQEQQQQQQNNSNNGSSSDLQQKDATLHNTLVSMSIAEIAKKTSDAVANVWNYHQTNENGREGMMMGGGGVGAGGASASLGGEEDENGEADDIRANKNDNGASSSSSSSILPFPSLLSMPSLPEVTTFIHRAQSLLQSLRRDATIGNLPLLLNNFFSLVNINNNNSNSNDQRQNSNGNAATGTTTTHNTSAIIDVQNSLVVRSLLTDYTLMCQAVEVYWHRVWQVVTMMHVRAERVLAGESVLLANGYGGNGNGGGGGVGGNNNNNHSASEWPQWLQEEYNRAHELIRIVSAFWAWFGHELAEVTAMIGVTIMTDTNNKMMMNGNGNGAAAAPTLLSANVSAGALHRYRDLLCRLAAKTASIASEASAAQLALHTPTQVKNAMIHVQRPQRLHNRFTSIAEACVASTANTSGGGGGNGNNANSNVVQMLSYSLSPLPSVTSSSSSPSCNTTADNDNGIHALHTIIEWSLAKPLLETCLFKGSAFVEGINGGGGGGGGGLGLASSSSSSSSSSLSQQTISHILSVWSLGATTVAHGCVNHNNNNSDDNNNNQQQQQPSQQQQRAPPAVLGHVSISPVATLATHQQILNSILKCCGTTIDTAAMGKAPQHIMMNIIGGGSGGNLSQQQVSVQLSLLMSKMNKMAFAVSRALQSDLSPALLAACGALNQYNSGNSSSSEGCGGGGFSVIASTLAALSEVNAMAIATDQQQQSTELLSLAGEIAKQAHDQRNALLQSITKTYFSDHLFKIVAEIAFKHLSSASSAGSSSSYGGSGYFMANGTPHAIIKMSMMSVVEYISFLISNSDASNIRMSHAQQQLLGTIGTVAAATLTGGSSSNDVLALQRMIESVQQTGEGLTRGWLDHISAVFMKCSDALIAYVGSSNSSGSGMTNGSSSLSAANCLLMNPCFAQAVLLPRGASSSSSALPFFHMRMTAAASSSPSSPSSSTAFSIGTYFRQLWLPYLEALASALQPSLDLTQPPPQSSLEAFADRIDSMLTLVKTLQVLVGRGGGGSGDGSGGVLDFLDESLSVSRSTLCAASVMEASSFNIRNANTNGANSNNGGGVGGGGNFKNGNKNRDKRSKMNAILSAASPLLDPSLVGEKIIPALGWILSSCLAPIEQNMTYITQQMVVVGAMAIGGGGGGGSRVSDHVIEQINAIRNVTAQLAVEVVVTQTYIVALYKNYLAASAEHNNNNNLPSNNSASSSSSQLSLFPMATILSSSTTINLMKLVGISGQTAADCNTTTATPSSCSSASSPLPPPSSEWQLGLLADQFIRISSSGGGGVRRNKQQQYATALSLKRDEAWYGLFSSCFNATFGGGSGGSNHNATATTNNVGSALVALFSNPSAAAAAGNASSSAAAKIVDPTSMSQFYALLSSILGHSNPNTAFSVHSIERLFASIPFAQQSSPSPSSSTSAAALTRAVMMATSSSNSGDVAMTVAVPFGSVQQSLQFILNRLMSCKHVGEACELWQHVCMIVSIVYA